MREHAKDVAQLLIIGALIMAGARAAEWIIPAPEARVVMCFANEIDQVQVCKSLSELLERARQRAGEQKEAGHANDSQG